MVKVIDLLPGIKGLLSGFKGLCRHRVGGGGGCPTHSSATYNTYAKYSLCRHLQIFRQGEVTRLCITSMFDVDIISVYIHISFSNINDTPR